MISKYCIFCKVLELGSFSNTAKALDYSQSAISQAVKSIEQDLGTGLLIRKRDGLSLTMDGEQFLPYIQAIANAETALDQKRREMLQLENTTIRIGTFTSISRNILPQFMKNFKELYPSVNFVLYQGNYTSINQWISDGTVDFGFTNSETASGLKFKFFRQDEMCVVLPSGHPLSAMPKISLKELIHEPFILLDEGNYNVTLEAFGKAGLSPDIAYRIYDDYTILTMIKQGLGISILYDIVVNDYRESLSIRPVAEPIQRKTVIAWNDWNTMTLAVRHFIEYIT